MAELRASHILVKDDQGLADVQKQLDNGASFEDLARDHSECPSGEEGGDLGWFGKGMMVKSFEEACFAMEIGDVSPPVKTQFGWHLIKLTGKR